MFEDEFMYRNMNMNKKNKRTHFSHQLTKVMNSDFYKLIKLILIISKKQ